MRISVIIPVYNAAADLGPCLDAVLQQRGVETEVICVDDGSTDTSAEILAERARRCPNLRVVRQPANGGQGAARNRGLDLAQGDYVYFMDADDELASPDALARLVEEMARARLDLLYFDAETRPDPGVTVDPGVVRADSYIRRHDYSGVRTGRALFADMLRRREFSVSPCLMVLRRAFVESHRLRFPSDRIFYEDNVFMTRVVLAAERASHRPWQLYVRKVHAGSTVTSAPTLRHLRGYLACYQDVCRLLQDASWDRPTRTALVERRVQYKLNLRRLMDAHPELLAAATDLTAAERAELADVRRYPLAEKIANGWRCLRDHGLGYTLRRILFGRQS